jgi:hypothetical protein
MTHPPSDTQRRGPWRSPRAREPARLRRAMKAIADEVRSYAAVETGISL